MSELRFDPSTGLTCIACRLVFANGDIQRQHYQDEWHRYNLKRKAADLPPVTAEQFQQKVLAFRSKAVDDGNVVSQASFCPHCNKQFRSANAYHNHLNSKKHKENEAKATSRQSGEPAEDASPTNDTVKKASSESGSIGGVDVNMENEVEDDDDGSQGTPDLESISEDDSELDESMAIPITSCLFCSTESSSMDQNLAHMSKMHGFFLPDAEYCIDVEGMLHYLGLKVGSGNLCLLCNEKGKRFYSLDACRKHMLSKGHCRVAREAADMLEYEDFYDYSSMYPEGEDEDDASNVLIDEGYSLVLPSGARIGHRSLMRYYRQRLKPVGDETKTERRGKHAMDKILGQYKALGWTGISGPLAVQRAKDIRFMKRLYAKQWVKSGVKANKLFKSRGRADQ